MSEEPRRYLRQAEAGQRLDEIFVIRNVQVGTKKDGEPYLSLMLGDKTGEVAARWWGQGQAMQSRLPDPGVVRVKGMMNEFNAYPYQRKNPVKNGPTFPSTGI